MFRARNYSRNENTGIQIVERASIESWSFEKYRFEKLKKKEKTWYLDTRFQNISRGYARSFSFSYSFIKNFPTNGISFHSFQWTRPFISLVKSWIYLWTNGFAALNDTLSFNLGPFYLCPPTHERLHPRKGRAIFSRHPLGVSHSCLFRAISIRPRLQRREKTSAR